MPMLNRLPHELQVLIYSYDPTYRVLYQVCMAEMTMLRAQGDELRELLVDQEEERNLFTFISDLVLNDVL
jgi:hypothetical protein